ncbi:hypothetical protein [Arenibaculum pallidiluteum]|uniref:hypothetical protein n=1 Tax=Arenibaculum pallidiluteum TaxID=2812559 RepID=UPI001A95726C|nr:hypothetical protein [Arenibaculum pallidiluteum]
MKRWAPFLLGWIAAWLVWRFLAGNPRLLSWLDWLGVQPLRSLVMVLCVFGAGQLALALARRVFR